MPHISGGAIPKKEIVCPYCGVINPFEIGQIDCRCTKCGKGYFRTMKKE